MSIRDEADVRLSWHTWRYAVRAFCELLRARVRVLVCPTSDLLQIYQRTKHTGQSSGTSALDLELIAQVLAAVARRVPWRADCLVQALAAVNWLRRYGHKPTLVIGIANAENFVAHAWVRCEDVIVTGGTAQSFTPIWVASPGATSGSHDEHSIMDLGHLDAVNHDRVSAAEVQHEIGPGV